MVETSQYPSYSEALSMLESYIANCKVSYNKTKKAPATTLAKLTELEKDHAHLNKDFLFAANLGVHFVKLAEEKAQIETSLLERNQRLEAKIAAQKAKTEELELQLASATETIQLNAEAAEIINKEREDLQRRNAQIDDMLSQARNAAVEAFEKELKIKIFGESKLSLEELVITLKKKGEQQQKTILSLEKRRRDVDQENAKISKECQELSETIGGQKEQLEKTRGELTDAIKKIEKLKGLLRHSRTDNEEKGRVLELTEKSFAEARAERDHLRRELATTSEQLTNTAKELDSLKAEAIKLGAAASDFQMMNQMLSSEVKRLQDEQKQLKDDLSKMKIAAEKDGIEKEKMKEKLKSHSSQVEKLLKSNESIRAVSKGLNEELEIYKQRCAPRVLFIDHINLFERQTAPHYTKETETRRVLLFAETMNILNHTAKAKVSQATNTERGLSLESAMIVEHRAKVIPQLSSSVIVQADIPSSLKQELGISKLIGCSIEAVPKKLASSKFDHFFIEPCSKLDGHSQTTSSLVIVLASSFEVEPKVKLDAWANTSQELTHTTQLVCEIVLPKAVKRLSLAPQADFELIAKSRVLVMTTNGFFNVHNFPKPRICSIDKVEWVDKLSTPCQPRVCSIEKVLWADKHYSPIKPSCLIGKIVWVDIVFPTKLLSLQTLEISNIVEKAKRKFGVSSVTVFSREPQRQALNLQKFECYIHSIRRPSLVSIPMPFPLTIQDPSPGLDSPMSAPGSVFSRRNTRRAFTRKEPMQEFFILTYQACKLNDDDRDNMNYIPVENLYETALKQGVPFNRWHDWIKQEMKQIVFRRSMTRMC
mmetsp:Transcript_7779/g.14872  ORF Transcript_7779/g.14872 Transcript_7779/m.14872 type:complete len:823 (-) Transcript_7779:3429-5897(-)